jgi:hypothetical protein
MPGLILGWKGFKRLGFLTGVLTGDGAISVPPFSALGLSFIPGLILGWKDLSDLVF